MSRRNPGSATITEHRIRAVVAALLGGPLVAFLGFREIAASDLAPGRDIVISEVNYNPPSDPDEDALLPR